MIVPNYERDLASLHYYQAEAHVARAYYYSELIKQYGGVPIVESPYADGQFVSRSSYDEVVDYIVSEIDNCKDRLAVDWNDYTERNGRFTLGAAWPSNRGRCCMPPRCGTIRMATWRSGRRLRRLPTI